MSDWAESEKVKRAKTSVWSVFLICITFESVKNVTLYSVSEKIAWGRNPIPLGF
jgi:hypothetical protein